MKPSLPPHSGPEYVRGEQSCLGGAGKFLENSRTLCLLGNFIFINLLMKSGEKSNDSINNKLLLCPLRHQPRVVALCLLPYTI